MCTMDSDSDDTIIIENQSSIEEAVKKALPDIKKAKLARCIESLKSKGVKQAEDLQFIEEADLGDLTLIEARKCLSSWKFIELGDASSQQSSQESIVQPPSTIHSPTASVKTWLKSLSDTDTQPSISGSTSDASPPKKTHRIPWEKFPPLLMEALRRKERPDGRLRREMVRIIIDHINRKDSQLPRSKELNIIAKEVVDRYPDSFGDSIDGFNVGSGHDSLHKQLVNKVDNLQRPGSNKRKLKSDAKEKNQKINKVDSYGCVQWMPDYCEGDSEDKQRKIMTDMKSKYELEEEISESDMKKTYVTQRRDINNNLTIQEIGSNWPYLFQEKHLYNHFEQLTSVNIFQMMEKAFESTGGKVGQVTAFLKTQDKCTNCWEKIEKSVKEAGDETPQIIGVIGLLSSFFKEDFETAVLSMQKSGVSDVEQMEIVPDFPCLVAHGDPIEATTTTFSLAINHKVVETLHNRMSALSAWFAAFYVFNFQYPEEMCSTLEFIQRCFVGINPTQGSKRGKKKGKRTAINQQVLALANKLKDFQSEWSL